MRTDADDLARVRDPAIELMLRHTATFTDGWCSRRRPGMTLVFGIAVQAASGLTHDDLGNIVDLALRNWR